MEELVADPTPLQAVRDLIGSSCCEQWEAMPAPHPSAYRTWIRSLVEWFKRAFTRTGTSSATLPLETEAESIPTSEPPAMPRRAADHLMRHGTLKEAVWRSFAAGHRLRLAQVMAGSVETLMNLGQCSSQREGLP